MEALGHDCWQVIVHFGFKNDPDVPRALRAAARRAAASSTTWTTSYFLSRDIVIPTLGSGMAPWREKLFASMHRNASGGGRLPEPADQPRGRARLEGRDLSTVPPSLTRSAVSAGGAAPRVGRPQRSRSVRGDRLRATSAQIGSAVSARPGASRSARRCGNRLLIAGPPGARFATPRPAGLRHGALRRVHRRLRDARAVVPAGCERVMLARGCGARHLRLLAACWALRARRVACRWAVGASRGPPVLLGYRRRLREPRYASSLIASRAAAPRRRCRRPSAAAAAGVLARSCALSVR